MITASQVRRARVLLGWTSQRLGKRARLGLDKVLKAQDDAAAATLNGFDLGAIRAAFERAGLEFAADGRRVRVRARAPPVTDS